MQQEYVKVTNNNESKLHCEIHPDYVLQILHFADKPQRKSRILCLKCLTESYNKKENLDQFVCLHDFLIDPKNSLWRIINLKDCEVQQNLSQTLDEMEKLLLAFEEKMKNQMIRIKENIQQMRIQQEQILHEFLNELKLNDVVQQIKLLNQMDSCQGTSELANLENQLNFISQNLQKVYICATNKGRNNQQQNSSNILDNLKFIKDEVENLILQYKNYLLKLEFVDIEIPEDIREFPQIHQQISEGKYVIYQLLYQGTRDGLNGQQYWAKCNLQQNLLTLMTSKNGNKFGGYSPCQINQQIINYVEDPTMKSFIFQYNKKEIYKLKNKQHAVYCSQSYGPTFGQSCDIYVNADFQNGHSHTLGTTYDISGYKITDKTNHIFEAATPQLQECKVFKVHFC